jgi:6-phosphogluconolactonase/glucosamine-6-phosphate isomerase/deaminase
LIATGEAKAEAVRRVVSGDEGPETCPARLLAPHGDVTLYADEPAASLL